MLLVFYILRGFYIWKGLHGHTRKISGVLFLFPFGLFSVVVVTFQTVERKVKQSTPSDPNNVFT